MASSGCGHHRGRLRADARLANCAPANAAVVPRKGASAAEALKAVSGVTAAEKEPAEASLGIDGFDRWRVTGEADDLCPALFEALRKKAWKVAELRSDTRTLEAVFRDLAQRPDVETDVPTATAVAGADAGGDTSTSEEVRA